MEQVEVVHSEGGCKDALCEEGVPYAVLCALVAVTMPGWLWWGLNAIADIVAWSTRYLPRAASMLW